MRKLLPIVACLLFTLFSKAQGRYDSAAIEQRLHKIDVLTNILRDFRFKAFVQAEWQKADTAGINTVQGQNFPAAANNRFLIRQGRFILGWEHEIVNKHGDTIKIGQFALNENLTERGFSGLYEFYGRIFDPWTGWFSLRGGIFTTPFGFETPVAVDVQESPEQSRVNSNIFPMESNLGGEIIIESPRTFRPFYLRVDAGVVNGDGILVNSETGAYQSRKDFIGRAWFGKFWDLGGSTRFGFNASVSYYNGGVRQTTDNVYEVVQNTTGTAFENVTIGTPDTAWKTHVFEYNRDYYGAHLELNLDYKLHGSARASTMVRGEFIGGTEPSQATSDQTPTPVGTAEPGVDLYIRKFAGGAFYFTQSFHYYAGKQLMHTDLTFKCDIYNPNTQVSGPQLAADGHFSPLADMSWTTFSGGVTFAPVPYFKLMLWYDHVTNENTGFAGTIYARDYPKDDVFTIRTQFSIDSWWWDKKSNNSNLIAKQY